MQEIYLDNSATTPVLPAVAAAMQEILVENYGNPSSLHHKGMLAERVLKDARRLLAQACGANKNEIYFTSGGTEANNVAIKGVARRLKRRGMHLVTSKIEHPSVLYAYRALEAEGFRVTYLDVNKDGLLHANDVAAAVCEDTILVSVMHINNEVGSILPVAEIGEHIKEKNPQTLFHVDAVQSFAKIPIHVTQWQADLLTISAHKIHGPKGCGALYRRQGIPLEPLCHGGDQEGGVRPGTENVAGIAGFAHAARIALQQQENNLAYIQKLKDKCMSGLQARIPDVVQNGPQAGAAHILNVCIPGIKGEVLVHALEEEGIYLSTGSACHSQRADPSHVLQAMGRTAAEIEASLRISFSALITVDELTFAMDKMSEAVQTLRLMTRRRL
ncbi:MAG: cysteine desulfurase [Firmicutes bacterium]|nr:cysteine desulfurase [Bacillota bacterium]